MEGASQKLSKPIFVASTKPQIDESRVTLVQDGMSYDYVADITTYYLPFAILRRQNRLTGVEEIIYQDVRGCASQSRRIKKLATDGKDVYVFFDDSNERNAVGKVVKRDDGKYVIHFVSPSQRHRLEKNIKDLALEGGKVYVTGSYESFQTPALFGLEGLEVSYRFARCPGVF